MRVKVRFKDNSHVFKPSFQNMQIVDFTRNPVVKPLKVTENGTYTAPEDVDGFNPVTVDMMQVQGEQYEGAYEVTPKFEEQILQTAEKVMKDDLKIKEIEITIVSNDSGGNTVIIGG